MKTKILQCKKCKGTSFNFRWEIKDRKHAQALYWMHDGIGFQITDSIVTCATCDTESEYDYEDFLEVVEQ